MPSPEINVRLTADGVQDVVNAFKRVQQESRATKNEIGLLGEAGQQLKELIPLITLGAAIEKTVELGKSALDTAINIGKLSEKTGASAGTLSVLLNVAEDLGVSQEQMSTGLVKLARAQEMASQGSKQQLLAFKALGISLADIRAKNPGDLFIEIAQKLQKIPDGATKAAATMTLLGRSGADLIPVLNDIGQGDGFEKAKEQAERLGFYLSDQMVADAKAAQKAMADLKDVADGFAMRFMSGFTPEMTDAVVKFSNTLTAAGGDGVKQLGEDVGLGLNAIVRAFLDAGNKISVVLFSIFSGASTVISATLDLVKGDLKGASSALADGLTEMRAAWEQYAATENKIWPNSVQGPSRMDRLVSYLRENGKKSTGASGDGLSDADREKKLKEFQKLVDARSAYQDQVANDDLVKQKLRDQQAEAEEKAMYDADLVSLNQYYDARAARINQEMDAEEAILKQKLANQVKAAAQLLGKSADFVKDLISQSPQAIEAAAGANAVALKMLQNIAAAKAQIDESELKRHGQLQANDQQRYQAAQQAIDQEFANRQKLYELQGMTSQAQQVALDKELHDTDLLLQKLGVAEGQRRAILDRVRTNATARNQLGALSQSGGDSLANLQNGVADIQDQAAAGAISELQATAQIYNLEKQRIPGLQQIAQNMQSIVDNAAVQLIYLEPNTDEYRAQLQVVDDLQKQVDGYTKQVNKLATAMQTTKTFSVELQNQLATQGTQAFNTFFDDIFTGSKDAKSAFADLGKAFEDMIVHMIDQMIIYYTLMALVGWIAPGSSLFTSLSKSGPFNGLTGHAGGGWTGNAATNKVTGMVHGQEFVVKAGPAGKYRPLLEAMNAGVGSIATAASYAGSGSSAGAGGGDSGAMVQINIDTGGQPASQSQRQGPGGTSIIDLVIGQVASDISAGGKVGQSIQSTFSVSRRGIRRG